MFTGIVTDVGEIVAVEPGGDVKLKIRCRYDLAGVDLGASIACAGVCLTVTEKNPAQGWFAVAASAETRAKTTLGDWGPGRRINLERALKVGDELGGHIVSGHVDGVATIVGLKDEGDSTRVRFLIPADLALFVAPKGSIALDGCSLTVNEVEDGEDGAIFGVNLIAHTKEWTTFDQLDLDDRLNVEIDVLARYVSRLKDAVAS